MNPRHTRIVALVSTILLTIWTVFCVIPGPGLELANSVAYVTFISHLALVLTALGWYQGAKVEEVVFNDANVSDVLDELRKGE